MRRHGIKCSLFSPSFRPRSLVSLLSFPSFHPRVFPVLPWDLSTSCRFLPLLLFLFLFWPLFFFFPSSSFTSRLPSRLFSCFFCVCFVSDVSAFISLLPAHPAATFPPKPSPFSVFAFKLRWNGDDLFWGNGAPEGGQEVEARGEKEEREEEAEGRCVGRGERKVTVGIWKWGGLDERVWGHVSTEDRCKIGLWVPSG